MLICRLNNKVYVGPFDRICRGLGIAPATTDPKEAVISLADFHNTFVRFAFEIYLGLVYPSYYHGYMRRIRKNTLFEKALLLPNSSESPHFLELGQKGKRYFDASAELIFEALWPTRCVICDKPGILLCDSCRLKLSYVDYWRSCKRCGGFFGSVQCSECNPVILKTLNKNKFPFSSCTSALQFDSLTARIATAYKDGNEQRLSIIMAQLIAETIAPDKFVLESNLVVTNIPASNKAFRRRGFDHGELLAKDTASLLGLRFTPLLQRPQSKDQRELSRKERIVNMDGRFKVAFSNPPDTVLLIDDVYTTGATLCAASEALLAAGVKEIHCATFARVW